MGSIDVQVIMYVFIYRSLERPRVIETLLGKQVVNVACGGSHSAAITNTGELYTWGKGRYGRLGEYRLFYDLFISH